MTDPHFLPQVPKIAVILALGGLLSSVGCNKGAEDGSTAAEGGQSGTRLSAPQGGGAAGSVVEKSVVEIKEEKVVAVNSEKRRSQARGQRERLIGQIGSMEKEKEATEALLKASPDDARAAGKLKTLNQTLARLNQQLERVDQVIENR